MSAPASALGPGKRASRTDGGWQVVGGAGAPAPSLPLRDGWRDRVGFATVALVAKATGSVGTSGAGCAARSRGVVVDIFRAERAEVANGRTEAGFGRGERVSDSLIDCEPF